MHSGTARGDHSSPKALRCATPHREQADVRKDVALQVRHVDRVHVKAHQAGAGVVLARVRRAQLCAQSWCKNECHGCPASLQHLTITVERCCNGGLPPLNRASCLNPLKASG
jgi:hypothetical protein